MGSAFDAPAVRVIDDFFDPLEWGNLRGYISRQPMRYGAKSNSRTDPYGHWSWKPVHDHNKNLASIEASLPNDLARLGMTLKARLALEKTAVIRCYANGYTYGTDGYLHQDSDRDGEMTVIIYMVDEWHPDFGGETVFFDYNGPNAEIVRSVLPRPGRIVIAPSSMAHAARAVSRKCGELRRTLMFKLRPLRSETFEAMSTFLVGRGALGTNHSVGTLHDHLMRVFALMEGANCSRDACVGGALHSVYGTNSFQHRLIDQSPHSRSLVASVCGKEGENLAYMFSLLDRPRTLDKPVSVKQTSKDDGLVMLDMTHGQNVTVTLTMYQRLMQIECANLLDQRASLAAYPNLMEFWKRKDFV